MSFTKEFEKESTYDNDTIFEGLPPKKEGSKKESVPEFKAPAKGKGEERNCQECIIY